jgi:hypothetical protein
MLFHIALRHHHVITTHPVPTLGRVFLNFHLRLHNNQGNRLNSNVSSTPQTTLSHRVVFFHLRQMV